MKELSPDEILSRIFRAISTPTRLQILAAIGTGEACVCHLEALLDLRQAYISQQLMEMRDADLVDTRRDGRYVFYRLTRPQFVDRLLDIAALFDISSGEIEVLLNAGALLNCSCPKCLAQLNPALIDVNEIAS